MRPSAKQAASGKNRAVTGHMATLHQRMYHALNLGFRSSKNKEKWSCTDIEIQRLVIRSIDAFLDCISKETSHHLLVKDSVDDIVKALESILGCKSVSTMKMATDVTAKMVNILPVSMLQPHVLDLIRALADVLSFQQLQVANSCAAALNSIFSKFSSKREREVQQILDETKAVGYLVQNIKTLSSGDKPIEYFQEIASLLCKILWRWPPFRFSVWSDSEFLNILDILRLKRENFVKAGLLQLYSALALCGNGVEKLLENGDALLRMMVDCMNNSNTYSVRVEAFKLAQSLMISKRGGLQLIKISCEPLVEAIVSAMSNWSPHSEKPAKTQRSVTEEACRSALITRWAGDHHMYFWKAGIDRVLVYLLLDNYYNIKQLQLELSVKDQIFILKEGLSANPHPSIRPYVWEILGWLAANCAEDFNPGKLGSAYYALCLMLFDSVSFVDLNGLSYRIFGSSSSDAASESSARAVLMMIYSPCRAISDLTKSLLSEVVKLHGKDNVEYVLGTLKARSSGNKFSSPGNLQTVTSLMTLACYSTLPKYRKRIIRHQGMTTLLAFLRWWLNDPPRIKWISLAPHLYDSLSEKSCCLSGTEEWEGEDMFLLFALCILAQLLHHSGYPKDDLVSNEVNFAETQLISDLQAICLGRFTHGPRWYAAYILSCFGLYGFPSNMGEKIGKILGKDEYADLELTLVHQDSVYVHGVILSIRCPSLLPPAKSVPKEKESEETTMIRDTEKKRITSICLSAHVDHQSLMKLLEYVYLGYLQASEDLVKNLKIFARHCNLQPLLQMLCRRSPKWGTPVPSFDLTPALGLAGYHFSDIRLEATEKQLLNWKCRNCSASVPHIHAHKIVLQSSCDYLQALFHSGMQESRIETVEVPVSWESLTRLVNWFYSDFLPQPTFDCLWDNLDIEDKLCQVQSYIELCWLTEFWLINDLHEECYKVALLCLDSSQHLSSKIIQIAANFSQWKLVEVAANHIAPSYHHLRLSGELDALDKSIVEMIRSASVRLSQQDSHQSSVVSVY